jgi:hypothetical protein
MTELVDVPDLKSGARNSVPVQFRLPAPAFGEISMTGPAKSMQLLHPDWLMHEPWFGDIGGTDEEIRYLSRLNLREEHSLLSHHHLGVFQCKSGQLMAASFGPGLEHYLNSDEGVLHIPTEPCEVHVVLGGDRKSAQPAYLSLRWKPSGIEAEHAVVQCGFQGDAKNGFFDIEQNLLGLFDLDSFRDALKGPRAHGDFINKTGIALEASGQNLRLPRSATGIIQTIAPAGIVLTAPKGIAAAVVECETPDVIAALHFDFCAFHGVGAKGEYNSDWKNIDEFYELQRRTGLI